jgi:hypothetical protein
VHQFSTGPMAVSASTTKSVLDLATGANNAAFINKWWVASDATSAGTATSAIRVQVGRFNAAVTTHTAGSVAAFDAAGAQTASQSTVGSNTTVEGAGTPTVFEEHILGLTQSELIVWEPKYPYVQSGSFWRIRLIIPAGIGTTNIYAGVGWDE